MSVKDAIKGFLTSSSMKKFMLFLATVIVCAFILVITLWSEPEDRAKTKNASAQAAGMPVSVRSIEVNSHPATVTALGEVVPLWQTTIKAQVNGQIVFLSRRLQAGNIFKQGELLVKIEKSSFEMQVALARSSLARAEANMLMEDREAREAQKNWKRSGIEGDPESPLVLREPQLTVARSEISAAQAELAHAETLLGYTEIRAPYDSIVVQRVVNPGETLFAGEEVATLYSMETAEVSVYLSAAQWNLISAAIDETQVTLTDAQQQATWKARIVRESRRLSRDSRMRTVFLEVEQPLRQASPLLPGTFVRAEIKGTEVPDLLCIPEAALTKQGIVWFVDSENRLSAWRAEPMFYGSGVVYVRAPEAVEQSVRVAISPNTSFVSGLAIQPVEDSKER